MLSPKKVKFRIAEAAVNKLSYKAWGFNPVVMPWPDVPVALKQGVITGLDHTLTVCSITKKFEVAKYFTELNYAQGLFIWLFNKAWFNKLPADLQKTLVETVRDMCAEARVAAKAQEMQQRKAAAEKYGVEFFQLSDKDMGTLIKQAGAVPNAGHQRKRSAIEYTHHPFSEGIHHVGTKDEPVGEGDEARSVVSAVKILADPG